MSHQPHDVLVGAYQDLEIAKRDFDAVTALVKARKVKVEGVILVEHHEDGDVSVVSTGDHLGRHGLGLGRRRRARRGAAAAAAARRGGRGRRRRAAIGKFADHRLKSGLGEKIGEALPLGGAGIIAVARSEDRLAIEQAMPGTPAKSVVQTDEGGLLRPLKDSLAEAMHKFEPDRSSCRSPIERSPATAGPHAARLRAGLVDDPGPKAPEGAPNVLIVLIDDAGFGAPDTFGGPVSTPNYTRVQQMGTTYNRFHVTAVCSPTRAALLTGRNQHRVGFGSVAEFPGPFPGYTAAKPKSCAGLPRILAENGYVTGGFGKWHLTPNNVQGAAGPFDHWPKAWGFNHWWGFLSGAAGQYDPIITMDDTVLGVPEGQDGEEYYFPDDLTDKATEWLHRVRAQDSGQALVHVLFDGLRARPAPRRDGVGGQVQGPVRRRLGRAARADPRAPEGARDRAARHRAHRTAGRPARVGRPRRHREGALRAADGGLLRLPGERRLERRPAARRDRGAG